MSGLVACPFCRQMFPLGEAFQCPDCGLDLERLSSLPISYEATLEDPEPPLPPHIETLPWTYLGRGRGLLFALAILGLIAFFAPWVRETAPNIQELSGFAMARRLPWIFFA